MKLLQFEEGYSSFLEYCKSSYCDENVLFWKDIQKYKELAAAFHQCVQEQKGNTEVIVLSRERAVQQANYIRNTYLTIGTRYEVNLGSEIRDPLMAYLSSSKFAEEGEIREDLFLNAEAQLVNILVGIFFSFATTDLYSRIQSRMELPNQEEQKLCCSGMELVDVPVDGRTSTVKWLDLSNNAIRSWNGLEKYLRLEHLIIDGTGLTNELFSSLPPRPSLRTLWANNNKINNLDKLLEEIPRIFPELTYLSIIQNPCVPSIDAPRHDQLQYRYKVIQALPKLRFLDSHMISKSDRSDASSYSKRKKAWFTDSSQQVAPSYKKLQKRFKVLSVELDQLNIWESQLKQQTIEYRMKFEKYKDELTNTRRLIKATETERLKIHRLLSECETSNESKRVRFESHLLNISRFEEELAAEREHLKVLKQQYEDQQIVVQQKKDILNSMKVSGNRSTPRKAPPGQWKKALPKLCNMLWEDSDFVMVEAIVSSIDAADDDKVAKWLFILFGEGGKEDEFVRWCIHREVAQSESSATLFRGNSFATKVLKYHAEKYGQQYLKQVICTPLQVLLQRNPVLEVDPLRAQSEEEAKASLTKLESHCEQFLTAIFLSLNCIPERIRAICHLLNMEVKQKYPEDQSVPRIALAGYLFLRLIIPSLCTPERYNLANASVSFQGRRNLTLVAKVLQNVANGSTFKEEYMRPMTPFLETHSDTVKKFFTSILQSSVPHRGSSHSYLRNSQYNVMHNPATVTALQEFSRVLKTMLSKVFSRIMEINNQRSSSGSECLSYTDEVDTFTKGFIHKFDQLTTILDACDI